MLVIPYGALGTTMIMIAIMLGVKTFEELPKFDLRALVSIRVLLHGGLLFWAIAILVHLQAFLST